MTDSQDRKRVMADDRDFWAIIVFAVVRKLEFTGVYHPRLRTDPLAVLSPGSRLVSTPSRGEWLGEMPLDSPAARRDRPRFSSGRSASV
jgi:hypothetical protein